MARFFTRKGEQAQPLEDDDKTPPADTSTAQREEAVETGLDGSGANETAEPLAPPSAPIDPKASSLHAAPPTPEETATGDLTAENADSAGGVQTLTTDAPVIGGVATPPTPLGGVGPRPSQPSFAMDGLRVGDFHVAAASLVGRSHLATGSTRQDSYDFVLAADGQLVVAIADGLGSRERSQFGARAFCEAVTAIALDRSGLLPEQLLRDGAAAVARASEASGFDVRDVAFVGAVAVFGPRSGLIARVGDVSAFHLADGSFSESFTADADEAVNVVRAALPIDIDVEPETAVIPDGAVAVLCTDGLAGDLRNSAQVRTWLASRWTQPADAFWMADSLRYLRRGSQDDRTGVVVHRMEQT